MNAISGPRLVGDVGGTHARFGWLADAGAPVQDIRTYPCAEHSGLCDAIRHYLSDAACPPPRACAIGIANPINGDEVRMTNLDWQFSISALQQDLAVDRLVVINDFTALALAIPHIEASALKSLGPDVAPPPPGTPLAAPIALIGAGTGLGVSGLIPRPDGAPIPIAAEGGHATLAAMDEEEEAVVHWLRRRYGHASAERALSGPGLRNLYEACCDLQGTSAQALDPAGVVALARSQADPACEGAVRLFCQFLGGVAGNLALMLGASGGVYIGGGIAPRLLPELNQSGFRRRFEDKGRLRPILVATPTWVIDSPTSPALLGAAQALA